MPQVLVVNLRVYPRELLQFVTKVDRSTILGNPFKLDHESKREEVVTKYRKWLVSLPPNSPQALMIRELRHRHRNNEEPILLGCWCAPRQCHADVIKEFIEYG